MFANLIILLDFSYCKHHEILFSLICAKVGD